VPIVRFLQSRGLDARDHGIAALHAAIISRIEGDPFDPMATALSLARLVAASAAIAAPTVTFA